MSAAAIGPGSEYYPECFRCIVVDDEDVIRNGVRNLIEERCPDVVVVAEFAGGIAAIEWLEAHPADLAVIDIRMPGVSGLQLAELIHDRRPAMRTIIVTGYREFDYAHAALRHGVAAYLLKPLDGDQLASALAEAVRSLLSDRDTDTARRILRGRTDGEALRAHIAGVSDDAGTGPLLLERGMSAVFMFVELGLRQEPCQGTEFEFAPQFAAGSILEMIATSLSGEVVGFLETPRRVALLILPTSEPAAIRDCAARVIAIVERAVRAVDESLIYSASIGEQFCDVDDARRAYRRAREALMHRTYLGVGRLLPPISTNQDAALSETLAREAGAELAAAVISTNGPFRVERVLQRFFARMATHQICGDDVVEPVITELLLSARASLRDYGFDTDTVVGSVPSLVRSTMLAMAFSEMQRFLTSVMVSAALRVSSDDERDPHVVRQALQRLRDGADAGCTLESLAEELDVSPNYLSKVFHEATGETFKSHVTRLRVEHAKDLLRMGNLKVYQVADAVGFRDARYFSRLFRRYAGVLPNEYRRSVV